MAAEIRSLPAENDMSQMASLLAKLEGHQSQVNHAIILNSCDGVVSISEDKNIIIWQKHSSGTYWPSVCHTLPAVPVSMLVNEQLLLLFVGMENGSVSMFTMGQDFNKITLSSNFLVHEGRVAAIHFWVEQRLIFTVGKDKRLVSTNIDRGQKVAAYAGTAPCTALQLDEASGIVFVGDSSNEITIIKLNGQTFSKVSSLKGHSGSIRHLVWDNKRELLYSSSNDKVVICWDIGGKQGSAYEFQGHSGRVSSIALQNSPLRLFTAGEDRMLISWNMQVARKETPIWLESDNCQRCGNPFFWNIKSMVDQKKLGLRQHHCRKCGKAVCDTCSSNRSNIPMMGFEFRVRVCDDCFQTITDQDRISLAKFVDTKHCVLSINLNVEKGLMVTCGTNNIIKLWDVSKLLA